LASNVHINERAFEKAFEPIILGRSGAMTTYKSLGYMKAACVAAMLCLVFAALSGCKGAIIFGEDENGDGSVNQVAVTMTVEKDAERKCWVATFAAGDPSATLPGIDQASLATAITVVNESGVEVASNVLASNVGSRWFICSPMQCGFAYDIAVAEGVIADAEGAVFENLTLQVVDSSISVTTKAGSVDGDCFADFLVGDYTANGNDGLARLYYGNTTPSEGMDYAENVPPEADNRLGAELTMTDSMGVTTGGGPNLLIGARTATSDGGLGSAGKIYLDIVSLLDAAILQDLLYVEGEATDQRFGFHVAFVGDVNNDGYGDFVGCGRGGVADPDESREPRLFLGPWGSDLDSSVANAVLKNEHPAANWNLGFHIKGNADFDGDGIDDIFVSSATIDAAEMVGYWVLYFYKGGQSFAGEVQPTSYLWGGGVDYQGFGYLYDLADVNGDGYADLIVSAIQTDMSAYPPDISMDYGAAFIFFGPRAMDTPLLPGDADVMFAADDEIMGFQAASAGDVNGDGIDDVLVVSLFEPLAPGYPNARAYLYLGRQSWDQLPLTYAKSDADLVISGVVDPATEDMDEAIYASAGIGDLNNDGYDDFAIGAFDKTSGQSSIYVFMGSSSYSGSTVYLGDAALKIDSPDAASSTGMTAVGSVWSGFSDTQYPIEDYKPEPEQPPEPEQRDGQDPLQN